ncbi:MAG TPA: NAD(P)H-quinone oxidoreductase [Gemmatimonadaceae bacterium]
MRACVITRPGGPAVLEIQECPVPQPARGEVLVRVRATALNRADLLQRLGRYPAPPGFSADIPGLEFAGEVAALGPDASVWREGDRVFGITGGGAHAEFLVAHERTLARIPDNLSFESAAAVPESFITAHDAMITQAGLRSGERVLVTAVASGVGLAAVQLARATGARSFGTTRTPAKLQAARDAGLDAGVAIGDEPAALAGAARDWSDGLGVDVALDLVGGRYASACVEALGRHGRLMLIGTMGGAAADLSIRTVMDRRLTIRGTVLRARPLEEKITATQAFARQVVPLLADETVKPTVDSTYDLDSIAAAHEQLERNSTAGKIVIRL